MTRSTLLLGALALAVAGGAVALAIAVNPGTQTTPTSRPVTAGTPSTGNTAFVAPERAAHKHSKLAPITTGGFAHWTGREGTVPGELEEYATVAGIRLDVALELRRSTVLAERTADTNRLAEILDERPSAEVLAAIQKYAAVLHDATANIQVDAREGSLSSEDAIRETRAAEDAYRRAYQTATGLTDQQFERFFAP